MTQTVPVFDGHNDFLLRPLRDPDNRETIWLKGNGKGHLDLPRMKKGGFAGGFFAIYISSPEPHDAPDRDAIMDAPPYDMPLDKLIGHEAAQSVAMAMAGHLMWMERAAPDEFKVVKSADEIQTCLDTGTIAGVMHMEGAEAIGPDLDALHVWHAAGLRSIGPVWSRPTVFGHGVPFRYPGNPDTGQGLTDAGKALVRECNTLKIMLDLSHLNEKGFNDVAAISDAPLVATHSNAHAITPSTRNLTDRQLEVIRDSGGMVGLNFATVFLRPDGRKSPDMTLDPMLQHLDYLLEKLGENHVGLGSDFDGATVPNDIVDVTGLPVLQQAMIDHGYGPDLVRKICHENWVGLLRRTWGS